MLGRLVAWVAGGLGAAVVYRRLRRRAPAAPDPAEALRRKLERSRGLEAERGEVEGGETLADPAEPVPPGVDERRREVHERGRAALDEMRGDEP